MRRLCCLARSGEHSRHSGSCNVYLRRRRFHTIYPSTHSQEEADLDNIALVGHETEKDFHSVQQMDTKIQMCSKT